MWIVSRLMAWFCESIETHNFGVQYQIFDNLVFHADSKTIKIFEIGLKVLAIFSCGTIERRFLFSSANVTFNETLNDTSQCLSQ